MVARDQHDQRDLTAIDENDRLVKLARLQGIEVVAEDCPECGERCGRYRKNGLLYIVCLAALFPSESSVSDCTFAHLDMLSLDAVTVKTDDREAERDRPAVRLSRARR